MKETRLLMGMPVTVEVLDEGVSPDLFEDVFGYFQQVDDTFSTYKESSEISRINRGEIAVSETSEEVREVFRLAEETKRQTGGYFDILTPGGVYDPSGLVKGWAIERAAGILRNRGMENFFVEAGGDVQAGRPASFPKAWSLGIRNPFNRNEIVKVLNIYNEGVATSGSYIRGRHIYNPHKPGSVLETVVSITVVGPNVYESDRFATAAFAMGEEGVDFIESLPGLEAYQIDSHGTATQTSGFMKYIKQI